jgi:cyclic dehypoxanthinyl futalosine synthase
MSTLKLYAVQFLNAHPLYAPLATMKPVDDEGNPLFELHTALPAECARKIASGEADVALLPVGAYAQMPELEVVPELAIAARGAVDTVIVVGECPLEQATEVLLDGASRSSVALLKVLLHAKGLSPTLTEVPHGEGAAQAVGTTCALVIGDAAFGLKDTAAHVTDLAAAWFQLTGLPMVFAFWAARPGVLTDAHVRALQEAKARGLKFAEQHAAKYRKSLIDAGREDEALPVATYADYLRKTIRYDFDSYEREGLVEFLSRAQACGAVEIPGLAEGDTVHVVFKGATYAVAEHARASAEPLNVDTILAKGAAGERLSFAEGLYLYDNADLFALGEAADARRQALHPDDVVTYIIDRNVNYTNVCTARCQFCNFYRPPGKDGGYVLSREVLAQKFRETEELGGVQILLQGGLNPDLGIGWYEDFFRWTKQNFDLRMHALSPTEIIHIAHLEDLPVRDVLQRLHAAGLDSLPGGGAEMLHDDIRNRISPFKNSTDEWIEVMRVAHEIGMKTTCTMVFGFQETAEHALVHLDRLRETQDLALSRGDGTRLPDGRFTAFIVWPFQSAGTSLRLRDDTTAWRYLRMQALARLYLDNIPNIQVSWPTLGPEIGEVALRFGANDFGSVMIEENVVSKAGAHFMLTAEDIEHHIRHAGFTPSRRNMQYDRLTA